MSAESNKCWSSDKENFNCDSLDELIDFKGNCEVGDTVYCGEKVAPSLSAICDADDVIELMGDWASDIAGEFADGYPDVTKEAEDELNALLDAWMRKHCMPTFYTVTNIREYILTAEDIGTQ